MPPTVLPTDIDMAQDTSTREYDPSDCRDGWCMSNNTSSFNAWACAGLLARESGDVRYFFTDDVHSFLHKKDGNTLIKVTPEMRDWYVNISVPMKERGREDGITGRQLPWFSPWMRLAISSDVNPFTCNDLIAINLSQVESIHVSVDSDEEEGAYAIIMSLHGRQRLAFHGPSNLSSTEFMDSILTWSGQKFIGPFIHDSFHNSKAARRSYDPSEGKDDSTSIWKNGDVWDFPGMKCGICWSVLIQQAAVVSMVSHDDCHPVVTGAGPYIWRMDIWTNNSRHLSNVLVPSHGKNVQQVCVGLLS